MEIQFKEVGFIYQKNSPFENRALSGVNFTIQDGSYTAIVGHTGSGKSTILQHLNALKIPTEGVVKLGEKEITSVTKNKGLKDLRKKVGIVFQFPESQLFEETIAADIAFGPMNFGMPKEEAYQLAEKLLTVVGLDATFMDRSPFDLSGGQMRRVAIAGVLALQPEVLVLDEPTAGLDPKGRLEIMEMFARLRHEQGLTIVLVTHQMEDVASYADHVVVVEKGTVVMEGSPRQIFKSGDWLQDMQLGLPQSVQYANKIEEKLGWTFDSLPLTTGELADQITKKLNAGDSHD